MRVHTTAARGLPVGCLRLPCLLERMECNACTGGNAQFIRIIQLSLASFRFAFASARWLRLYCHTCNAFASSLRTCCSTCARCYRRLFRTLLGFYRGPPQRSNIGVQLGCFHGNRFQTLAHLYGEVHHRVCARAQVLRARTHAHRTRDASATAETECQHAHSPEHFLTFLIARAFSASSNGRKCARMSLL
jgi:hypothetical protein